MKKNMTVRNAVDCEVLPAFIDWRCCALFLDLDGTLAEISPTPSSVRVEPAVLETIAELSKRLDGALAIISGRELNDIDRLLTPHVFAAAGVHGATRRSRDGVYRGLGLAADQIGAFAQAFANELGHEQGLLVEQKSAGFALHYRARPDLKQECSAFIGRLIAKHRGLAVIAGKSVFEIVAAATNKGQAIAAFLKEDPFRDRIPIFAGDDVTDEDGFSEVNRLNGISIKIGSGHTAARFRLSSSQELASWLAGLTLANDGGR